MFQFRSIDFSKIEPGVPELAINKHKENCKDNLSTKNHLLTPLKSIIDAMNKGRPLFSVNSNINNNSNKDIDYSALSTMCIFCNDESKGDTANPILAGAHQKCWKECLAVEINFHQRLAKGIDPNSAFSGNIIDGSGGGHHSSEQGLVSRRIQAHLGASSSRKVHLLPVFSTIRNKEELEATIKATLGANVDNKNTAKSVQAGRCLINLLTSDDPFYSIKRDSVCKYLLRIAQNHLTRLNTKLVLCSPGPLSPSSSFYRVNLGDICLMDIPFIAICDPSTLEGPAVPSVCVRPANITASCYRAKSLVETMKTTNEPSYSNDNNDSIALFTLEAPVLVTPVTDKQLTDSNKYNGLQLPVITDCVVPILLSSSMIGPKTLAPASSIDFQKTCTSLISKPAIDSEQFTYYMQYT